ncbi:MAG: aminotransferase class V-fold PLP-dependent enzyme [Acidobacteriota bacterium]
MRFETLTVHAGRKIDPQTRAVTPPIHMSTTFEREVDGSFPGGHVYTRSSNYNRHLLEAALCELEGGQEAAAFASGSAATSSVLQALDPGDHVIAPVDSYHGTTALLRQTFARWGLQISFVDLTEPAQAAAQLRPNTRLIWIETPSNPMLRISPIRSLAEIAHQAGALCVCDNTWASPVLQHPLELGADAVMHATTKYLGGHSDVLGGVLISKLPSPWFDRVRQVQVSAGAVPSPFDCWLVMRGLRTLACRMRAHCDHAAQVAAFLDRHPSVEQVHYPGLSHHPQHSLAASQMSGFGGMLSFQVSGGKQQAMSVASQVKIFTRATSLGGTESLIEHRASIEGPGSATPDNLLRCSIGLEHPDDLIEDLAQALDQ